MSPAAAARLVAHARRHPRHLLLAAGVVGLLLTPVGPLGVVPVAVAAGALGGRRALGLGAAAAVVAGALAGTLRLAALDAGHLAAMTGRPTVVRAIVLEPVRERAAGPAVARARLADGPAAGEQAVLRIPAFAHSGPWPDVGEEVVVRGRVTPLGRADAYQRRRNAHAAIAAVRVTSTGRRRGGLAGGLDRVRRRAERGLARGLAPPEAALVRGMVLGEDERLTEATRDDFQRSGLAHILAVSGQNVMLLAALIFAVCAVAGVPLRARLLLTAGAIALYVPLAGGGPSIQRAGVMGIAGLSATLAGRPARRWYALGLAGALTLLLNPRAAGEPGWQLSFAAVAALLAAVPALRSVLARRLPAPVADAAGITLAATAGTAPLMALHFGQVSLAAVPANLLAAPAVAPVMWLGVGAAGAAQLSPVLAAPFTALTAPLLVYVRWVAHVTAAAPLAAVPVHASPLVTLAGSLALVLALAVAVRRVRRSPAWVGGATGAVRGSRWRPVVAIAAAVAAIAAGNGLAAGRSGPAPGELVVSFLDIGQGDATLLQLDATAVLIDTGPPDGPIVRRLREAGVKRLDALLLTHAQADHEGAAAAVLSAFPTRLVLDGGAGWRTPVQRALPRALAADRARAVVPEAGQALTLGGIRLRVLWPPPPSGPLTGDPNQRAVVARAEVGAFSMLLTADAESDVTAPLDLAPVDVLKVAHHGSVDAGLPALLSRLHPRIAAIEVGRHNTYGHPAPATLAALRADVPTILRTDRDGTARLHVAGRGMWVERP